MPQGYPTPYGWQSQPHPMQFNGGHQPPGQPTFHNHYQNQPHLRVPGGPISDQVSINSGNSSQSREKRSAFDLPADVLAFDSHEWVNHDDELRVNKTMIGLILSWKTEKCKN